MHAETFDPVAVTIGGPTARTYGYARVSTGHQDVERQRHALRQAGVDPRLIIEETASGAKERPALDRLVATLRPGDTLVVDEISRLGRRTAEVVTLIDRLDRDGVGLRVLGLGLDLHTPAGRLVASMLAACAQLERDLLRERTRASIEARRARGGSLGGRPRALTPQQVKAARAMAVTMTQREVAEALGVSVSTVKRALRQA